MEYRIPYWENKNLSVINFFGGPGCGKTTTAAYLFGDMKVNNFKVELVHEAAKGFYWDRVPGVFGEQDWIFAHQNRLIRRLVYHDIEYAIVDSSILLSLFYMPSDFPQSFKAFVIEAFNSYNNINILLERNPDLPYVQAGRNESEIEAIEIDRKVREYFETNSVPYYSVQAGTGAVARCLDIVSHIDSGYF